MSGRYQKGGVLVPIAVSSDTRFESCDTAMRSRSDEDLREELLRKLVDRHLLGPTQEILVETDIQRLPIRELPPGNTSSLYLMYLAYMRAAGGEATPASKSTFFEVAKAWKPCLRFRRKSDHAMCFECSRLKHQIQKCKEPKRLYIALIEFLYTTISHKANLP